MASLPRAAVVVEDRYSSLFKLELHQARVRHRAARRAHRPLPDRPDPLRRDTTARRGMDLPVPRRRARLPPSHDPGVLTSHAASLVLTGPAATLTRTRLDRRRECPDPDATIPAHAAQAARSNAAAESTAGPARTISRAPTSPTKPVTPPAELRHLDDDELRDLFDELFELPSSTSRSHHAAAAAHPGPPTSLRRCQGRRPRRRRRSDPPDPRSASTRPSSAPGSPARSSTCATPSASTRCSPPPRSSTSTAARESCSTPASFTQPSSTPANARTPGGLRLAA